MKINSKWILATYLTVLTGMLMTLEGCALLSTFHRSETPDPIAQAAYLTRFPQEFSQDQSQLEDHQAFQAQEVSDEIERGLELGEIVLGMKMNDVISIWGQPREIESAGDPRSGNQKWVYLDSISSRWKLGNSRIVYFESGRVTGWDTQR